MKAEMEGFLKPPASGPMRLSAGNFSRLAAFISNELGIRMPESKFELLQHRLQRRVRELEMKSVEEYAAYFFAAGNIEEREHLINAVTTNKTDFFREIAHYQYLSDVLLPQLSSVAPLDRINIWSAGCSSGEEPYSLAMLLQEFIKGRPGLGFAILGTDVSTRVLARARSGIYPEWQLEQIPSEYQLRYLLRSHDREERLLRIVPELRRKVSFHQLNFMDEDYGIKDHFQVVLYRNVLIYFEKEEQEAIVTKISRNIAPGGHLFIGHSESLSGLDIPVQLVQTSIYRKSK
jgi:chemotaxis protein methyltransferase CheR